MNPLSINVSLEDSMNISSVLEENKDPDQAGSNLIAEEDEAADGKKADDMQNTAADAIKNTETSTRYFLRRN